MSTYLEKKALLKSNKKIQNMWIAALAVSSGMLFVQLFNLGKVLFSSGAITAPGGFLAGFLMPVLLVAVGLNLWIIWGTYRMERWVTMWMWLAIIGAAVNVNVTMFVASLIILLLYKPVLKFIYSPSKQANQL